MEASQVLSRTYNILCRTNIVLSSYEDNHSQYQIVISNIITLTLLKEVYYIVNATNVNNIITDYPEKYGEHNVSSSDGNNMGEGNIMTLT